MQHILARADEQAAASLPPGAKAIFTIEGEEPEAAEPYISKSRLRSVLTAVEEFSQERLSRRRLEDLLAGINKHNCAESKIDYSENIKKLDELILSIAIKKNLV